MTEITADFTTLIRQASMTADEYLMKAITNIDARLGQGYAKAHPELIAAFMQAAAIDMGTATIAKCVDSALEEVAGAITDAFTFLKHYGSASTGSAENPKGVTLRMSIAEAVTEITGAGTEADPTSALDRIAEALQNIAAMIDLKVGGR
jgi:hypothetical protein